MKKNTLLFGMAIILASCSTDNKSENPMDETVLEIETNPIIGSWELTEQNWSNADTSGTESPFKSIIMFSDKYYSVEIAWEDRINWTEKENKEKPTFEEYENAYNGLTSNSGSYEIQGDSMKRDIIVAKHPNFMNQTKSYSRAYTNEGDVLTTSYTTDNGYLVEHVHSRMK